MIENKTNSIVEHSYRFHFEKPSEERKPKCRRLYCGGYGMSDAVERINRSEDGGLNVILNYIRDGFTTLVITDLDRGMDVLSKEQITPSEWLWLQS